MAREPVIDERTGYRIPIGTYEQARAEIGRRTEVRFADAPVSWSGVKQFCALVHDGNASYWDPDYAAVRWGGVIAPPASLMTWVMPLEWRPDGAPPVTRLTAQVPLPGDSFVNASNEVEFLLPVRVGDELSVVEELTDVSEEKSTALGPGHFVTTVTEYRRGDGQLVARETNVLLRFETGERGDGAP